MFFYINLALTKKISQISGNILDCSFIHVSVVFYLYRWVYLKYFKINIEIILYLDNVADNHLMAKKKFNEENDSCSILRNKIISNLISVQYLYTANTYEKNKNDNSVVIENDNSNLKINNFLNNSQSKIILSSKTLINL